MKSKDQQLLEEAYTKINESARLSDSDILTRYKKLVAKLHDQEITYQQWTALSLNLLGDIVNAISKDAAGPEREISQEEDEQMIAADLANK